MFQIELGRRNPTPKPDLLNEFPLTDRRDRLLILGVTSADKMRPTHIKEGDLVLQYIDPNVDLVQKHPHRHTWNHVWPNVRAPCGPGTLTHTIN